MMIYNSDDNHLYQYNINGEWIKMTEFKVGDKVRIKETDPTRSGLVGEIMKKDEEWCHFAVHVMDADYSIIIKLCHLEHIEPKRKFKPGDIAFHKVLDTLITVNKYTLFGEVECKNNSNGARYLATEDQLLNEAEMENHFLFTVHSSQPKFKIGDKVRTNKDVPYTEMIGLIKHICLNIRGFTYLINVNDDLHYIDENHLELVEEVCTKKVFDDPNCGCHDTKKSAWEKETKQALYDKIKPAVEQWAKEQNEKTVAKRKFKNGDLLALPSAGLSNLKFVKYLDDGNVVAVEMQGVSAPSYREPYRIYYPEIIAPESSFVLRHEYEAQQKPQVGDKVWVKGTIVQIDDSQVPYRVDFVPGDKFVGTVDTMMLWIRNVKKRYDLED